MDIFTYLWIFNTYEENTAKLRTFFQRWYAVNSANSQRGHDFFFVSDMVVIAKRLSLSHCVHSCEVMLILRQHFQLPDNVSFSGTNFSESP